MSLRAKGYKDVRGAYRERQKALGVKDHHKGKVNTPNLDKPWKISKGYGARAGRVANPGRNYGRHPRREWLNEEDLESDTEAGGEYVPEIENDHDEDSWGWEMRTLRDSHAELPVLDNEPKSEELSEQESYEFQLARALSLSLGTAGITADEEYDIESLQDGPGYDADMDDYSLLAFGSEASDVGSEYETDFSIETDWVDLDEFGEGSEHLT